jgi:RimJ/RimL family protein N-acetyltransferase
MPIEFSRSFDYELIRQIMTHPKLYPHISDDGSPPREEYRPPESEAVWYVIVRDADEVLGLFMLVPQNAVCWEFHVALLPCAWGSRSRQAALEFWNWVWEHTPCRRIVSNVPLPNRLALRFGLDAGMKLYGINRESFLKNGILYDQTCLGLSRPEEMPVPEAGVPQDATMTAERM